MSLSVTYDSLRSDIGRFLGYGRTSTGWVTDQEADINECLNVGLRQFYWPPALSEDSSTYQWTFLTPLSKLELQSGQNAYPLPEDCDGMVKELTFTSGAETRRVALVREPELRQVVVRDPDSGDPEYAAVRTIRSDGSAAQAFELLLYPTPANARTLEYRYGVTPSALGANNQYPLGGGQHGETIRESCLAAAESVMDDTEGVHAAKFARLLVSSIRLDAMSLQGRGEELWPDVGDSLSVDRAHLERMIGRQMGFGAHAGGWSTGQHEQIKEALRQGLRQFYQPPVLPGERSPHEWSFLRPVETLQTQDGVSAYELPAAFAHLLGPMSYSPGTAFYPPVRETSEHQIRIWQQATTASGPPTCVAIRPRPLDAANGGTRYEALLWPTPDAAYSLNYRCALNPDLLAGAESLPYGGQPHAQTVLESCLAMAEVVGNSKSREHAARFMMCLQSSVGHDRRVNSPQSLGMAPEWEQSPGSSVTGHDLSAQLVTYNGVAV